MFKWSVWTMVAIALGVTFLRYIDCQRMIAEGTAHDSIVGIVCSNTNWAAMFVANAFGGLIYGIILGALLVGIRGFWRALIKPIGKSDYVVPTDDNTHSEESE